MLLLDIIAGRVRPGCRAATPVKAASSGAQHGPVSLSGLLRATLCKQAQVFTGLGEASKRQHPYVKSVADMNAQRQRAAQAAEARRNAPMRGLTGDTEYDNLSDVKRRRLYENMERQKQEYLRSRPDLIQRKDQATIQKEMGPVKSWGDSQTGRTMVRGISDAFHTAAGLGGSAWLAASRLWDKSRSGTSFMDEQREYWKNHNEARDDVAHDTLNNYQIFANSAANGAGTIARGLNYGAHKVLGASDDTLYSLNNAWDNANAAHKAKMDALQGQFRDKGLSDPNSTFGKINRFAMEQTGKALGETAALGAVGGVAGQVGRGITAGTRALSGAVRGAQAARTVAQAAQAGTQAAQVATAGAEAASAGARAAGWGARAVQGARNMAAKGIDYAGDALASPLNMTSNAILHPVASARSVGGAMVNFVRHPLKQGLKAMTSDKLWKPYMGVSAWNDIAHGDIGGAAGQVGDMAAMGGLGMGYLPVMGYRMYKGFQEGAEDPYPYGEY